MIVPLTGALLALASFSDCLPQAIDPGFDFSSPLCQQRLEKSSWVGFAVPYHLKTDQGALGKDNLPFADGYQQFLVDRLPGVSSDNYECGSSQPCTIGSLNDNCLEDPMAATILKGMANWSNFYQQVSKTMGEAADFIVSQSASMPAIFNPNTASSPAGFQGARIGLITTQFLFALMPLFPPLQAAKEVIGVVKDSAGFTQGILGSVPASAGDAALAAGYDSFADISRSAGALRKTGQDALARMIQKQLNSQNPYEEQGGLVAQIVDGDFAEAAKDFTQDQKNLFTAAVAAPAINNLWNKHQVVVARFSKKLFKDFGDHDPCQGDNIFPGWAKYCDSDGNAFVLRTVPKQGPGPDPTVDSEKAYQVPGFDKLAEFSLNDVKAITQSAYRNQIKTDSYFGSQQDDQAIIKDLVDVAKSDRGVELQDTIFFNLPVCDLDAIMPTDRTKKGCNTLPTEADTQICIVNTVLLCGCPGVTYGGKPWPYQDPVGFSQCAVDTYP